MTARLPLLPAAGACVAVAAGSLLAPWTPAYDPWAWLVWGREVGELALDTTAGPAWKPLPVAVTALLDPLGDAAPAAWLVLARAGGLLSVVLAARLAAELAGPDDVGGCDAGARVGAAAAALAVLGVAGYARGVGFGSSEGILAALGLWAADRHLRAARGQAFALGLAAALLRPEAWPFVAAYGALLWRREPARRRLVMALGLAAVPALWLGPELWGSGDLLRSSRRAQIPEAGAPALAARPALEVAERFAAILFPPAAIAAVAGTFAAWRRREAAPVVLTAGSLGWVVVVAAMGEAGYSGEERYLLFAAVLASVPAGVGVARAYRWAAARSRVAAGVAAAAATVGAGLAVVAPVGADLGRRMSWDARLRTDLAAAVHAAGGPRWLAACGRVYAGPRRFPLVAWHLRRRIAEISGSPRAPGVVLRSRLLPASPLEPAVPAGFRRIAAHGRWEVYASC